MKRRLLEARLKDLSGRIRSLSPPERLRLAADLLEERQPKMALQVAESVTRELHVVLGSLEPAKGGAV